ncbi:hypothetical protein GCM10010277_82260 [Streptomyces longisporoflavus]|uniref:hypothetical protein n=1 Tax=Streptomyces longisporoflavus TaxID=28044 RepID=UPI00167E3D99|nr:hypothetical protein [Streptomyces longisporoflavus]GGV70850.1 hypothetical protein GCM10010277_82260 [Streptomyces longisporoflavus]
MIDATSIVAGALIAAAGTGGILVALFRLHDPAPPGDDALVGEGDLREAPAGEQPWRSRWELPPG